MGNSTEVRGMNKTNQFRIKVRGYRGASSIDIIDHLKPSLIKGPDVIMIHAGTNDIRKLLKKIVKLVRETLKYTKLFFSSTCRTDIKISMARLMKNLENYCKQQNLGIMNNYQ